MPFFCGMPFLFSMFRCLMSHFHKRSWLLVKTCVVRNGVAIARFDERRETWDVNDRCQKKRRQTKKIAWRIDWLRRMAILVQLSFIFCFLGRSFFIIVVNLWFSKPPSRRSRWSFSIQISWWRCKTLQEIAGPAARLSVKNLCILCVLWFPSEYLVAANGRVVQ